jgi:ADP-ribosylglycohydrolase
VEITSGVPGLYRVFTNVFRAGISFLPDCETRRNLHTALTLDESASVVLAASVLGVGHQLSSHDTVPFALWCASRTLDRFEEFLWLTVSGLGDRDTTCAIVGGIAALALGENALPSEWEQHCEDPPF